MVNLTWAPQFTEFYLKADHLFYSISKSNSWKAFNKITCYSVWETKTTSTALEVGSADKAGQWEGRGFLNQGDQGSILSSAS